MKIITTIAFLFCALAAWAQPTITELNNFIGANVITATVTGPSGLSFEGNADADQLAAAEWAYANWDEPVDDDLIDSYGELLAAQIASPTVREEYATQYSFLKIKELGGETLTAQEQATVDYAVQIHTAITPISTAVITVKALDPLPADVTALKGAFDAILNP